MSAAQLSISEEVFSLVFIRLLEANRVLITAEAKLLLHRQAWKDQEMRNPTMAITRGSPALDKSCLLE